MDDSPPPGARLHPEELTLTAREADDPSVLPLLAEGEIVAIRPIPSGSNYSFYLYLDVGRGRALKTVYKPRRGEAPLWDFPSGTLYQREYAAFLVAGALGMGFIPPTVIRDGPHGPGTVQLHVEADERAEYFAFRGAHLAALRPIALFDVITNNADRKATHCILDRRGRVWGIDHGLCFNVVPKLRTVIWEFCGELIPDALLECLSAIVGEAGARRRLARTLEPHLHPAEIEAFFVRVERVAARGEFPTLDPYRNIPRGFW